MTILFWTDSICEYLSYCSSISAILSTIIGVHFEHVLVHFKVRSMVSYIYAYLSWRSAHFTDLFQLLQGHQARLKHWILMGFALLISGIILHFTHGVNWTLSICNFCILSVISLFSNFSPMQQFLWISSCTHLAMFVWHLEQQLWSFQLSTFWYSFVMKFGLFLFIRIIYISFEYGPMLLGLRLG